MIVLSVRKFVSQPCCSRNRFLGAIFDIAAIVDTHRGHDLLYNEM